MELTHISPEKNNANLVVLPIEEISLRPENKGRRNPKDGNPRA